MRWQDSISSDICEVKALLKDKIFTSIESIKVPVSDIPLIKENVLDISGIKETLVAQHVTLKDHIRRTELIEEQLVPISKHVEFMNTLAKVLVGGVTLASVVFEAWNIIHK